MCTMCMSTILISTLSGCIGKDGQMAGGDKTLADANEVRKFYAEELKGIDLLDTRVHKVEDSVQFMRMDSSTENELLEAVKQLQPMINTNNYAENEYFKRQMHDNIKAVLGDKVLMNGKLKESKRTRDVYILDMQYDMVMRGSIGNVSGDFIYLGLNGAFKRLVDGTCVLDRDFLSQVTSRYNEAAAAERLKIQQGLAGSKYDAAYNEAASYIDTVSDNYARYNNVIGSTLSTPAIMPNLNMVFNVPGPEGDISGFGIRSSCTTGLQDFGFDRNNLSGTAIVRYMFREDSATGAKHLDNVYVLEYEFDKGIPAFEKPDVFPDFAETSIQIAVERADRVVCNSDITGGSNGKVFGNKLFVIEYGNKTLSTKQLKYASKITEELKRNNRLWLVKVENKETEEVKYVNKGPATFQEVKYVVLEQYGDSFITVDEFVASRKAINEPVIDYADTSTRRYNYLYNAGNVSEESKKAIKSFMSEFYSYNQNKEWQKIADSICSDTKLLARSKKSEMYYNIREYLIKSGDQDLKYSGAITEWLGGSSDPQVEFKTIELLQLPSGDCIEFTKYYLVSVFNDKWVINDIKELTKEELKSMDDVKKIESIINGYNESTINEDKAAEKAAAEKASAESANTEHN